MLDQVRPWLENLTPEMRVALREGSLVLAALLCGQVVGSIVTRMLRARNFDALLRLPGSSPAVHGFTPTAVAGLLLRLTIWGAAGAWLAHQHGYTELAGTVKMIINRTLALAAVLVVTLWLGNLLASAVIDCLKAGPESAGSRNGAPSGRGVAGAVAAGVYGLVVLFALLMTADFFGWPLTHDSASALWQFVQHGLLPAGAALLVGYLGAGWARDTVMLDGTASPERRAGQYTGLGIVAATTMLAVAVLLFSAGFFFGLASLALLGLALWLLRGHLPDIAAGLQLRANQVREVWFDGAAWQVSEVGLITSQVSRGGQSSRVQNRLVLEARMHGKPAPSERPQTARPVVEAAAYRTEVRNAR